VLLSDTSSVELVMIGGDVVYGRPDWLATMVDPSLYEPVIAWGRPGLLDTRLGSPEDAEAPGSPALRLADMRARLIGRYPNVGPIFS